MSVRMLFLLVSLLLLVLATFGVGWQGLHFGWLGLAVYVLSHLVGAK